MGQISLPPLTLKSHSDLFWVAILPEEKLEKKKSRPSETGFEVVAENAKFHFYQDEKLKIKLD